MGAPYDPTTYKERSAKTGAKPPQLRTPTPTLGLDEKSWTLPKAPGGPRKIFKMFGRKVRIYRQGDV